MATLVGSVGEIKVIGVVDGQVTISSVGGHFSGSGSAQSIAGNDAGINVVGASGHFSQGVPPISPSALANLQSSLIWLYDLHGEQVIPVHEAIAVKIEDRLFADTRLSFTMRATDPKVVYVAIDGEVVYKSRRWKITDRDKRRDASGEYIDVQCEALWMELSDTSKVGTFGLTATDPLTGLTSILVDSGWSVGNAPNTGTFSFLAFDQSLLSVILSWANITGTEPSFDTINRKVSLVTAVGIDRGIGFRYGRNMTEIKRKEQAPQATRLYAFGANSLTIENVNPSGLNYIEDYSYYTAQGLTLAEAQARYRKDQIWSDERYLLSLNLFDAARARLAALAQPTASYEMTVLDLSSLTGLPEDQFEIGDTVTVRDAILDIDVVTRVVRIVRYPNEPWRNEVELSYLRPGLGQAAFDNSARNNPNSASIQMLVAESSATVFASSVLNLCTISFSTTGAANGVVGGLFVGTATGSGTVRVTIFVDSTQIGTNIEQDFTTGQNIHIGIPTWFAGLAEGAHILALRASVIAGAGTVFVPDFGTRLSLLATGLLGGGASGSTLLIVTDIAPSGFSAAADSAVLVFETPSHLTVSDTAADAHGAVTDSVSVLIT